ncbi:sigma-70 family RNA polymerase sigma factor [Mesobacillus foraminis]|uniref:RNA polymerase sigma factor n=1 Tax=Mesobacillus foraminis TaxID=279826 RepID=UPI001BE75C52|nr:sigma-70 family RNA polymerase sigma factor [Mesobacillus foraminis]MBT2757586.1 sigma-70 family RNA polymerase sigma factor [Mesobacillus foraminis]
MEEEMQWINEVLSGNKQVYAQIINKYKNPLYATILRMTRNQQDAADLVQEAFIKVYHQLGKLDGQGSFSSWIYRVAINHCMDEFRKKRHKMIENEMREDHIRDSNNPEVIFLKKERNRQLEKLIGCLPEEERMIILLRYANELSYSEIGELMNLPLAAVRNKLHRAKKKLRETIQQEKGGYFHELSNER